MGPLKFQKIKKKHIYGGLKSKSFIKQTPPKVGILIQNTISKFSKTKNQTQKDPLKFQIIKNIYRRPQIKKFYKTDPTKSGNSDSNYNFKIFKNQKSNSKKPPKKKKKKKKKKS